MTEAQLYVGIDVSKGYLDVAVRSTGQAWRVSNTEEEIAALTDRLQGLSPALVVLEATRGPGSASGGLPGTNMGMGASVPPWPG